MFILADVNESLVSSLIGLKVTNGDPFTDTGLVSGGGALEGGMTDGAEPRVRILQRENGRLQEQLRSSEELNTTLRSELDLTRSIVKHSPQSQAQDKQPEQQNTYTSKTINSGRARSQLSLL